MWLAATVRTLCFRQSLLQVAAAAVIKTATVGLVVLVVVAVDAAQPGHQLAALAQVVKATTAATYQQLQDSRPLVAVALEQWVPLLRTMWLATVEQV